MMKIKLFDSNEVQDLYGVVVPHLDYSSSLTEHEKVMQPTTVKEKKVEHELPKQKQKIYYDRVKNTSKHIKKDNDGLEL